MIRNFKEKYLFQFYISIGKPTDYVSRDEQVDNAYWLVSIMQGLNLFSLLFIYLFVFDIKLTSKILFLVLMSLPLLWNYFLFKRKGTVSIIETVDDLLLNGKLKSKRVIIIYIISSTLVLLSCGALLNPHFIRWIKVTFSFFL